MIEFRPLASSSDGCCYVLTCGSHKPLIIDAGISFREMQIALEFRLSTVAGVLVSHAHGDHCKAVPKLLEFGTNVYASSDTWQFLDARNRSPEHTKRQLISGHATAIDAWAVVPFDAVHDMPGTMGFVIESPEGDRLLYATDTAYLPNRFAGLTHIAIEANFSSEILAGNAIGGSIDMGRAKRTVRTHMSLERLISALKANDLTKVQEIHLLHLSDSNSDEEAFKVAVERATGRPVFVAAKGGLTL